MAEQFNNQEEFLKKIEGYISETEGDFLYQTAKKCGMQKGAIVEIGSWKGKSTIYLGKGSKAGDKVKICAIDPHKGTYAHRVLGTAHTFEEFTQNIKTAGVQDVIFPIVKTSQEASLEFDQPVQFLFIDGEHEFEAVNLDFRLWYPKLIEGGIIAFHDCTLSGPRKVIEKYIYKSRNFKDCGCVYSIFFARKVKQNSLKDRIRNRVLLFLDRCAYLYSKVPWPKPEMKLRYRFSKLLK